ncbi:MAG: transporter permease [Thermoleophilia bacterium]|nr:transporter permease [Thermoleophilia bacterium]
MTTQSTPTHADAAPVVGHITAGRPGVLGVFAWEVTKLAARARARWTLLVCLAAPVVLVVVLKGQQRPPKDSLFGRYIHESGWALPLLILGFAAQWVLPLLTALVAGDIFANEDQHGTWKTVLTRSASRAQLFWAKTLTAMAFALVVLVVLAASTMLSSVLIVGHQELVGLSGQLVPSATAARLVLASWATAAPPLLAFTALAILLSVRSRSPAVGIAAPVVIGMVMQLVGSLGGIEALRPLLLTTPFEAWHGLLVEHRFYGPLVSGAITSAVWCIVALTLAFTSLHRRDITEG